MLLGVAFWQYIFGGYRFFIYFCSCRWVWFISWLIEY